MANDGLSFQVPRFWNILKSHCRNERTNNNVVECNAKEKISTVTPSKVSLLETLTFGNIQIIQDTVSAFSRLMATSGPLRAVHPVEVFTEESQGKRKSLLG